MLAPRLPLFAAAILFCATTSAMAQDSAYSPTANAAAVYESRLADLENQLRNLTGKIEQLEFSNRQMGAQLQRAQSDNDVRFRTMEQMQAHQANIAASMNASDANEIMSGSTADTTEPSANVTNMGAPRDMARPAATPPVGSGNRINLNNAKPAEPEQQSSNDGTPQEQYDRAFALLRQANYDDAEIAFKGFVTNNPEDKLVNNAKYWLAETYYVRGKHQEAAVAFAESYQAAPQGSKAPDSLLKLSMALSAMNNNKDACVALGELRGKFPAASASVKNRAEQESKRLKCGQAAVARNTAPPKKTAPVKPRAE
jgi:tol-pal system protein YbgF